MGGPPLKDLKRLIKRDAVLLNVDAFNTSSFCARCHQHSPYLDAQVTCDLQRFKNKQGVEVESAALEGPDDGPHINNMLKPKVDHKWKGQDAYHISTCQRCGVVADRDGMAADVIYTCGECKLQCQPRPQLLRRG